MKTKITSKAIRENYSRIYQAPYASLQFIMTGKSAAHYHCGAYGWNYDVYTDGNIAITTGYRSTFGTKIPNEIIKKYSAIAEDIIRKPYDNYEERMWDLAYNRVAFFTALAAI